VHYSSAPSPTSHSLRTALQRTRTRWIATAVLAVLALCWVLSTVTGAHNERSAWGRRRTVPIATDTLTPGHVITPSDISLQERPVAVLPEDIEESPVGQTVTRLISKNETVTSHRLAGGTRSGPYAFLDSDTIGLAIPVDSATPPVSIGDHVALFAPSEVVATQSRGSGPAQNVADDAVVIAIDDQTITVAVKQIDAPSVARALLASTVIIALAN